MKLSDTILEENNRRNAILDAPYNPYTGFGSHIERQQVVFNDMPEPFYLPIEMLNVEWVNNLVEYHSFSDIAKLYKCETDDIFKIFVNKRFEHDFEFWAAYTAKIKPKTGGDYIPFVLNYPQRLMHSVIYKQIINLEPIRAILLKSRQFGGSTYIDIFMGYIQIIHKTNWNGLIAAHIQQAATNIRFMLSTLAKHYPKNLDSNFTLKGFEGTSNIKIIPERNCKITIGSIESPDSIRADDVAVSHLTEVSSWKKTEGKAPEDLCQSILGTIPSVPWSMYALESTAKGIGNFFHRSWQQAISGENTLTPIFIPWHKDGKNRTQFSDKEQMISFYNTLSDYERFLWEQGATLEGINFYRYKFREMNGDEWRMKAEFPTTPDEAFSSSGQRVFAPSYTEALKIDCSEPDFKGDVFADARSGKEALKNVRFDKVKGGNLWIWTMPDSYMDIDNRYCAFADIGGRTKDADYSVLVVVDRYWMMEGGDPEIVAIWKGHLDQDLFAWKCVQICSMYHNALFAVEANSLDKSETEGGHFLTILDSIALYYKNIYARNDIEKIGDSYVPKYGFYTNHQTKGMIIDSLNAASRERYLSTIGQQEGYAIIQRDERTVYEMAMYEVKSNGTLGNPDGQHDDLVMATAGAVWLATSFMPLPKERLVSVKKPKQRKSESSLF